MEKTTKHRILGILVVLGIVVLMLPFFQSSNELPSEDSLIKSPAFPSEAQQQSSNELTSQYVPDVPAPQAVSQPTLANKSPDDTVDPGTIPTDVKPPALTNPPAAEETVEPAKESKSVKTLEEKTTEEADMPAKQEARNITKPHKSTKKSRRMAKAHPTKSTPQRLSLREKRRSLASRATKHVDVIHNGKKSRVQVITPELASKLTTRLTDTEVEAKGLVALSHKAWVVQVGSFKDKDNAIRLVNKLRNKGYRTFLQHVSADTEESSRVFVGPELKQGQARRLAREIEQQEHIRGFVVSYKPLQL